MCIKYNKLSEIQSHQTTFEGPTLVNFLTLSHLFYLTYLNKFFSFLIPVLFSSQEIIPALIKFKRQLLEEMTKLKNAQKFRNLECLLPT